MENLVVLYHQNMAGSTPNINKVLNRLLLHNLHHGPELFLFLLCQPYTILSHR